MFVLQVGCFSVVPPNFCIMLIDLLLGSGPASGLVTAKALLVPFWFLWLPALLHGSYFECLPFSAYIFHCFKNTYFVFSWFVA